MVRKNRKGSHRMLSDNSPPYCTDHNRTQRFFHGYFLESAVFNRRGSYFKGGSTLPGSRFHSLGPIQCTCDLVFDQPRRVELRVLPTTVVLVCRGDVRIEVIPCQSATCFSADSCYNASADDFCFFLCFSSISSLGFCDLEIVTCASRAMAPSSIG